jgi:streptogramin lyase
VVGLVHALGGGAPLVATPNSLAIIDPGRNRLVKVIPVGDTPRGVAVGRAFVWVANSAGGTVTQIDRETMKVVQVIGIGAQPTDAVEAYGGLWVVTGFDNRLVHLDPRTGGDLGRTLLSPDPDASAHAIAAGSNALWVATGDRVVKVDPSTGRRRYVCCLLGANDVAAGGNATWFVDVSEIVGRVNSTTLRVNRSTSFGVIPTALTFAFGAVWLTVPDPSAPRVALWRVDPQTMRVTQTTSIGPSDVYLPTLEVSAEQVRSGSRTGPPEQWSV